MTTLTLDGRYRLAADLAFAQREAKYLRGAVRPTWAADSSKFWFATREADGLRHRLVDVRTRQQADLFDHAALAAALSKSTEKEVKPGELGLSQVRPDPSDGTVRFVASGARWVWSGADASLTRLGDDFAAHDLAAPDATAAVVLDGPNLRLRAWGAADTTALTTDGVPGWGYGDFTDCTGHVSAKLRGPIKPFVLWSADSQRFAVMRADLREVPLNHLVQAVPAEGVRPVLHSYPYPMPGDAQGVPLELWFIGRDGSKVRAAIADLESRCFLPLGMQQGHWSADGRHFDFVQVNRGYTSLTLWRIDTTTGAARVLTLEDGPGVMQIAAGIAEMPMFKVLRDGRVLWWSQRSGWGHMYLLPAVDTIDGQALAMTQGPWLVRRILRIDEDRQRVIFVASGREPGVDPYFCFAYSVNFDGSGLSLLTPEPVQHEFTHPVAVPFGDGTDSVSPDGTLLVDVWSTVSMPHRSALRDDAGQVVMDLQTADPADSRPATMPLPEPFTLQALDAASLPDCGGLWGMLYKPPGFDPEQRYPVIELIYGAPQASVVAKACMPGHHAAFAEQLAALGFVVVMIDGPGTAFRSQAFQLASYGRLQSSGNLPDHINAIRWLAGTRPWMDLERVGIVGGSGGGYATVRAMGEHGDFYKVGVAMCGDHDNSGYVATWGDCYQGPYSDEHYAQQDNTLLADCITGDLFLIHGEMDDNVHPGLTLRVVNALIKADRNFDMLIVPNAGHNVIEPVYVQRRVFDYFVERLMGAKAPRPGARA